MAFRDLVSGTSRLCQMLLVLALAGCAVSQDPYLERHVVQNLTVVFLDESSLREQYASLSGHPAVSISGISAATKLHTVRGFFDFRTRTIYCPKMDFEVCGHELHHALIGRFHDER